MMHPDDKAEVLQSPSHPKRHRVRKWLRHTFKWCIDAFSFRCLLKSKSSSEPVSRDVYGSTLGSAVVRQARPPVYRSSLVLDDLPSYQVGVQDSSFLDELLSVGPATLVPVFDQLHTSDDDDLDMRIARQTAAEIEWYNEPTKPLKSPKKSGAWSEEEHERYCEGLDIYRYGSWKLIATHVGTRTDSQVRSHAQSMRAKRKRAEKRENGDFAHSKNGKNGANKSARTASVTPGILTAVKPHKTTLEELLLASMTESTIASSGTEHNSAQCELKELVPGDQVNTCLLQQTALDCVDTSVDIPLCSPPLDIMYGSFLTDEDLLEILHTPL